ncbi:MAG: DUF3368 domain-containing protein [Terriglobia bacterium]
MLVIADTTPLNYLILINAIEILPQLYGRVLIPTAVVEELKNPEAPAAARAWTENPPGWLDVRPVGAGDSALAKANLGAGEREAINLALAVAADVILIDERAGRREAARRHLQVTGTLGVLDEAAERGLIDFHAALDRLRQTSFRMPREISEAFPPRNQKRQES